MKFALRTVRFFRDQWEQVEIDNLEQDIRRRIKSIHFDKHYKEHCEAADNQELEKLIEEELIPKEGEDPLDEETKAALQKKLRFKYLTRGFYHSEEVKKEKPKKTFKESTNASKDKTIES